MTPGRWSPAETPWHPRAEWPAIRMIPGPAPALTDAQLAELAARMTPAAIAARTESSTR